MRTAGFLLTFLIGMLLAAAAVQTLSQMPFHQTVPLRFIVWSSPSYPLWYYATGCFVVGLLFGLLAALRTWLVLGGRLRERRKNEKRLEQTISSLRSSLQSDAPRTQTDDPALTREDGDA